MNAFDFVVTIALGSTLAAVLPSRHIALSDWALAFARRCGLQFVVTWSRVRLRWVRQRVTAEPLLLLPRRHFLIGRLRRARVTGNEVRGAGMASLDEAEAVVLATDGSFSIV